jgi:hypothetical protein
VAPSFLGVARARCSIPAPLADEDEAVRFFLRRDFEEGDFGREVAVPQGMVEGLYDLRRKGSRFCNLCSPTLTFGACPRRVPARAGASCLHHPGSEAQPWQQERKGADHNSIRTYALSVGAAESTVSAENGPWIF